MSTGSSRQSNPTTAASGIEIQVEGVEALGELEPLWLMLHHHHQASAPELAPYVGDQASWRVRRCGYERWLALPDSFLLVARADGRPIGYALVRVDVAGGEWVDTWVVGERVAEIETLVVAPRHRDKGLGTALLDRVELELDERGVRDIIIGIVPGNAGAHRLYEQRGYQPTWMVLSRFGGRMRGPGNRGN
jgi:GNAT superfamily N-acetyltransferase